MLQFILAGTGGGKTTRIMETIRDFLRSDTERITLIVPEQSAFTSEKNVLALVGPEKMTRVDVLSFTALGEKLIGKPAFHQRRRLSESAAAVLMNMALLEVKDDLKLYSRHADKRSSVSGFLALSSEFKQNGISADTLRETAEKMEDGLLKTKLLDIALILEKFDEKTSGSYFNPDDLLTELLGVAELDAYFKDRIVFIDSFRGFTNQEYAVIEHILPSAKQVYVALTTYDTDNSGDITDVFAKTKDTAARIREIAEKAGVRETKPQYLSRHSKYNNFPPQFTHYASPELQYLEANLYNPAAGPYTGDCGSITLCSAPDIYLECGFAASAIKKLVRSGEYRCRDIAVIARDISAYEAPLRSALKKCGLSLYEDYRKATDVSPIINIVSAAIAAVSNNFDNDSLMRYLKTGLTGLSTEDVSKVENYCYLWQISGSKWLKEWDGSPEGFGGISEDKKAQYEKELSELNGLREKIITPLAHLKSCLKGGVKGGKAVRALWNFIEAIDLKENVKNLAKALNADGEDGAVLELERMWNLLVDTVNELEALIRDITVTASRLGEIFEIQLSCLTVGSIPQGLDEVVVGSADRMRISSPRVAFILGANEGVFPPAAPSGSALTLKDRARMEELGLHLSASGEWQLADEKLIAYSAVCCAREKLFVTCSSKGADGSELHPCEFYAKIKTFFPGCRELDASSLDPLFYVEGEQPAFEQLAKSQPGVFRETLEKYMASVPGYSGRLVALQRAAGGRNFRLFNKETAADLFGRDMHLYPSRIEQYYSCPFSYFCKYGLKANPRKKAELDAAQMGTVNHHVLEMLLSDYSKDELLAMDDEKLREIINGVMDEYLVTDLNSPEDKSFLYLYDKLRDSLFDIAKRLIAEFEHCDFIPVSFELPIGISGDIAPYIPDGGDGSVSIVGYVDRVDIAKKDGRLYLRIVDYKSKQKVFKLSDVVEGISMQMLIYLFALWKNGGAKFGGDIIPAGVLYYNATSPVVSSKPGQSEEETEKQRTKLTLMTGIVLDDENVIRLMEHDGGKNFIPAGIDEKKGITTGEVINLEALKKLKEKADSLIYQMAARLRDGEISAFPSCSDPDYLPCSYCDYRPVCGFEDGMPVKTRNKLKTSEVIDMLMTEGDEQDAGNKVD